MKSNFLILILTFFSFNTGAKEIAITFDDSPRSAQGYNDGPTRAKKLIKNLQDHDVKQVAFFSVSKQLDEEGKKRLSAYNDAGHIIANHTHSHPDINKLTFQEYKQDFLLADSHLNTYKNFRKWFRYPYLREGDSLEKRDGMRALLKQKGYINAYITLNNYDWYIESLFQKAVKEGIKIDLEALKHFYVDVMMEGIEYYDEMAITHLGYSPKHVLLLHEMDISALFIGDLVDELRKKGWSIITPEDAYTDQISEYKAEKTMKYNPGRIAEIAKSKGQTKGFWHETLDEKYLQERFEKEVLNSDQ
jgi:peptidoglycan/xylan/chitin deacetylase (PgdA/CDA1 family)